MLWSSYPFLFPPLLLVSALCSKLLFVFCFAQVVLVPFGSCISAVPGSAPGSQYGTMTRQISRHNSTTSSASSAGFRRNPSVTAPFSAQPHINGGPLYSQNSSKVTAEHRSPGFVWGQTSLKVFHSSWFNHWFESLRHIQIELLCPSHNWQSQEKFCACTVCFCPSFPFLFPLVLPGFSHSDAVY